MLIWSSFTSAAAPEDARSTRVSSASNILRVKSELHKLIWFYKFWMTAIDISCESGFECIFSIRVERVLKLKWVHNSSTESSAYGHNTGPTIRLFSLSDTN